METSLFDAAAQGFLNLMHFKVFLAMLLGVAGGLYPAYRATRLQPVEALRYE